MPRPALSTAFKQNIAEKTKGKGPARTRGRSPLRKNLQTAWWVLVGDSAFSREGMHSMNNTAETVHIAKPAAWTAGRHTLYLSVRGIVGDSGLVAGLPPPTGERPEFQYCFGSRGYGSASSSLRPVSAPMRLARRLTWRASRARRSSSMSGRWAWKDWAMARTSLSPSMLNPARRPTAK